MARDALVVDGRLLPPGVERGDLRRHRPPHAPRPAEVVARRRVVDPAVLGRRDPALQASQLVGDVEVRAVERLDRGVRGLLHPRLQRVRARAAPATGPCRAPRRRPRRWRPVRRSARRRPPARRRPARAPRAPTGTSRPGRPWRRGTAGTTARTARVRRRPTRVPAARARRAGSRPSVAYARRAAAAPCSSSARTSEHAADSSSTESTSSPVMNVVKNDVSGSASSAACRAASSTCRRDATPEQGRAEPQRLDVAVDRERAGRSAGPRRWTRPRPCRSA